MKLLSYLPTKIRKRYQWLLVVALLIAAFFCGDTLKKPTTMAFVAFDLKATESAFIQQSAHARLSKAARSALSVRFSQALQTAIAAYAQDHHVAVLVKAAVVTGVPDATSAIQQAVAAEMHQGKPKTNTSLRLLGDE